MSIDYLHNHSSFGDLIHVLSHELKIDDPQIVEKDYWIMHVLQGLQKLGFDFQLKGGTSLSKGYKIIDRFSEDIDIHITPPAELGVESNPKKVKLKHIHSRKVYYDWLVSQIKIDGIIKVERDVFYDDEIYYRSGGIRLFYKNVTSKNSGLKDGILLEVGFDTVTPNTPIDINSWAFEKANSTTGLEIIDNRALGVLCYHPGFTFVEKLQTIVTKFRQETETGNEKPNLLRQYYDLYSLLGLPEVIDFIGSEAYKEHKNIRFPAIDLKSPIQKCEAFHLTNPELRARFEERYKATKTLYYKGQIEFNILLERIQQYIDRF